MSGPHLVDQHSVDPPRLKPQVNPVASTRRIWLAVLVAALALGAVLVASGRTADLLTFVAAGKGTTPPDSTTIILAEPEVQNLSAIYVQEFAAAVNDLRGQTGAPPLNASPALSEAAQLWAETMAAEGLLRHAPDVRVGAPDGWTKIGENVGTGETVNEVMQAFLDSPSHRENLYDADHAVVGIGVATDASGRIWTVQRFASFGDSSASSPEGQ